MGRVSLLATLAVAVPRVSAAAELRWTAPEPCGSAAAVAEDVERLLGHPLSSVQAVDCPKFSDTRPQSPVAAEAFGEHRSGTYSNI